MVTQKAISPITYFSIETRQEIEINADKIIDFTDQIFSSKKAVNFNHNGTFIISPEFEGKPNLVSYALYTDQNVADIMMFYSEISNPFSISSDMIVMMPDISDAVGAVNSQSSEVTKKKKNKSQIEFAKNINVQDKKRVMELIRQSNPSSVTLSDISNINDAGINTKTGKVSTLDDYIKSPNMTTSDQLKIIDGKVILGANVSSKKCSDSATKSQGLSTSIRQSILAKIKTGEI